MTLKGRKQKKQKITLIGTAVSRDEISSHSTNARVPKAIGFCRMVAEVPMYSVWQRLWNTTHVMGMACLHVFDGDAQWFVTNEKLRSIEKHMVNKFFVEKMWFLINTYLDQILVFINNVKFIR